MTGRIRAIDQEAVLQLTDVIREGGLGVIPTDTIYGVVCDPCNDAAIDALFAAKQRPRSKSLQVLVPSVEAIEHLGLILPAPLDQLSEVLLPGAFSPVCIAGTHCKLKTLRQENSARTQAVRVPNSAPCQSVLAAIGPLAASSANRSGQPSAQTAQEAYEQLGDSVDLYLDAGPTPGPVPSTVVACDASHRDGVSVLREGAVSSQQIHMLLSAGSQDLIQ